MKFSVAALLAAAASVVSAQTSIVSITSPLAGTVYTAGKTVPITWINPSVDTIPKIVLARGNPNALQPVATIAENVPAKSGSYSWSIPADIEAGNDYALMLGQSPDIAYTALFTVNAATGGASSSASSAASSAATSASSAASSKASSASSAAASTASSISSAASSIASKATNAASSAASVASSAATHAASNTPTSAGLKLVGNQILIALVAVVAAAMMF